MEVTRDTVTRCCTRTFVPQEKASLTAVTRPSLACDVRRVTRLFFMSLAKGTADQDENQFKRFQHSVLSFVTNLMAF